MRGGGSESGFAIALLLWMIAGMSLTVAAVIHFASADIGMAELRIKEAKAKAIGRGAALLALRDSAVQTYLPEDPNSPAAVSATEDLSEQGGKRTAQYEFSNGWTVLVAMQPSNGYISLNDVDPGSLEMLLVELGGLEPSQAADMAQGVIDYRYDFPGFRYTEELLAVEGVSRIAYDSVKNYVHPFRSGQTDATSAPPALQAALNQGQESQGNQGLSAGTTEPAAIGGVVTFESIAAEIEQRSGVSDTTIVALELRHEVADGETLMQQIWASPERENQILRVGVIASQARGLE